MSEKELEKESYQISFFATWSDEVEASSQEEAQKIVDENWSEMTFGYDTKLLNVEITIERNK